MEKWTYKDIPDQKGRVAIVTGANSGLGFYTTKGLAEKGCEVIMACRNIEKAEEARAELLSGIPDAKLRVMKLDLSSLKTVRGFSDSIKKEYSRLDLLINNAGLMAIPYRKTDDGFEMQFGVNHLGHFALTGLLIDKLNETTDSRIVSVSSSAHNFGVIRFDDINWDKKYNKWGAYGMSKLANIYFIHELADRISSRGIGTCAVLAHPGYADSKLIEKGPEMKGRKFIIKAGRLANKLIAQSSEMGALPTLYAATSAEAAHRNFYGPGGFAGMKGFPEQAFPNKKKISKVNQEKLWDLSESLTGVSFLNGKR
jgi:NAD(P)-dependent dehydrogenase (short-subunit alcohol dehydrogenase family)